VAVNNPQPIRKSIRDGTGWTDGMVRIGLRETTQLVAVDTGISQNSGHCAALEFAMKRHDQRDGAIRVLEGRTWLPR